MMMLNEKSIFGVGETNNITGIHLHAQDSVRVFTRQVGERAESEEHRTKWFFWVSDKGREELEKRVPSSMYEVEELDSSHHRSHYNHIVWVDGWNDMYRIEGEVRSGKGDNLTYKVPSPAAQWFVQTGETMYQNMRLGDVRRMQFDIETYSSTNQFPDADREGDEIIIIAISGSEKTDGSLYEKVLHTSDVTIDDPRFVRLKNERQLITEFVKEVHRYDPDVIEHHNGFGFDFPYMFKRAKMRGVNLALGRDNETPKYYERSKSFADRTIDYTHVEIAGRDSIDTYFLALDFDSYARDFDSYGLKYLAKYFDVAADNREYVPGDEISDVWDNDPKRLLKYALDDTLETRGISERLVGATFASAKALPMTMQQAMEAGQATRTEALFVREYFRRKKSLPKPEKGRQESGGYTDVFQRGVFENVVYGDVKSLYPSIMMKYDVQPESDPLGMFSYALDYFTHERYRLKDKMREATDPAVISLYNAEQQSYKIFINSFYGALSNKYGIFNDYSEGERVAQTGQRELKRIIQLIDMKGGNIILCDTDGVLFQPPFERDDERIRAFISDISDKLGDGIQLETDYIADGVFSYRRKNYVIKNDGEYKYKGSSLRSRSIQPFLKEVIDMIVRKTFAHDWVAIRKYVKWVRARIRNHEMTADEICKTNTLSKTLEKYEAVVSNPENVHNHRQPQYEVGKWLRDRYGEDIRPGSRVSYYVRYPKSKTETSVYQRAGAKREYDSDYDRDYYLAALDRTLAKFEPMFSEEDFAKLFEEHVNPEQGLLFMEPLPNIRIQVQQVSELPHKRNQPKR